MNFPSLETKKPWPFALKCPVSSKTETTTTAARTGCADSTKALGGLSDPCGEGIALDSTDGVADVAGVGAAERGEGSGARTIEALRSHETSVHRTRRKQTPPPLIVLTTSRAGRRLKENQLGGRSSATPKWQFVADSGSQSSLLHQPSARPKSRIPVRNRGIFAYVTTFFRINAA